MKKAIFSPLLKKQSLDFEVFSNFRPVSNIKFLSKVIEKVAAMCLSNCLCHNDVNETGSRLLTTKSTVVRQRFY